MSFWEVDGKDLTKTASSEYSVEFVPIPNNSLVLADLIGAKWKSKDEMDPNAPRFVETEWLVLKPDSHANRKVKGKLWIKDFDPSVTDATKAQTKQNKSRLSLAAIAQNAGGGLFGVAGEPTDDSMAIHLVGKCRAVIRVMVWEVSNPDGTGATGNWVNYDIKSPDAEVKISEEALPKPSARSGQAPSGNAGSRDMDDEIPF